MSTFSNPFAQLGDYRNQRASGSEDLVTTSYLTGLPDPLQFANQQFAFVFRMLLKRDERTRLRGLAELNQLVVHQSTAVDDQVHLAYVQLYAKFSIDASPLVRAESHRVLGALYKNLGRQSTRYLKHSVGLLLAGRFDPDARGAAAASQTLDAVFPNKQQLLVDKMKPDILEFVYDCLTSANALTLSDERYTTKEDAVHKYQRLLKTCFDLLVEFPVLFDPSTFEIDALLTSGRLWKFFGSQSYALSASAIRLARQNLDALDAYIPAMWAQLLKAARTYTGGDADLTIAQMLNVLTKRSPDVWRPAYADSIASLAQFVQSGQHGPRFWPLVYNLALMIPEDVRDLAPLYAPLRKTVLRLPTQQDLEDSCWGCFVMLCASMGAQQKAAETALARCKNPRAPVKIIAKYLARLELDAASFAQLLERAPFQFVLIVASMHDCSYKSLVDEAAKTADLQQLRVLLEIDASVALPVAVDDDPVWMDIACLKPEVAEEVVHRFAATHPLEVLERAGRLRVCEPGLLDEFAVAHLENTAVLEAAVGAVDLLVSAEVAKLCFTNLVTLALDSSDAKRIVARLVASNPDLFSDVDDAELRMGLRDLDLEDKDCLQAFDPESYAWTVSSFACTNALGLAPPLPAASVPNPEELLPYFEPAASSEAHALALLCEYVSVWHPAAALGEAAAFDRFFAKSRALRLDAPALERLYALLSSDNQYIAFFSALAIWRHGPALQFHTPDAFEPHQIDAAPALQAVRFHFGVREKHEQFQTSLARQIARGALPCNHWAFVDAEFAPSFDFSGLDASTQCYVVTALHTKIDLQRAAFDSEHKEVQYTALRHLQLADVTELLSYAQDLSVERVCDVEIAHACLELVLAGVSAGDLANAEPEWISALLRQENLDLQFIALHLYPGTNADLDASLDVETHPATALLLLENEENMSDAYARAVVQYIAQHLTVAGSSQATARPEPSSIARQMLYKLSTRHQQVVRDFYRDCRDRQLLKLLDGALAGDVVPRIMKQVKAEISESAAIQENTEVEVSVNEKLREVKASRELDEEFTIEMVLTLPEQYPAKPVSIDLRNLRGVSEAKKRGWILEARHNSQSSVVRAVAGLLTRLDNFLHDVEPCAICYSLVDTNNRLPNKECPQCHNEYHTECLYKWFSTNKDKLCPMCRGPL